MLTLLRKAAGLSQKALAEEAEITQSFLSKLENDLAPAPSDVVFNLASALGVPHRTLYTQYKPKNLLSTFFRRRKTLGKKLVESKAAQINLDRLRIQRLLDHANVQGFDISRRDLTGRGYRGHPEMLARDVRELWDIPPGPIDPLVKVLEVHGVIVRELDFGDIRFDGVSVYDPLDGIPPIIYTSNIVAGDRMRYTMAHELGHILLHSHLELPPETCEAEADRFAGAFLMPASDIRGEYRKATLSTLVRQKRVWKISMAAQIMISAAAGEMTAARKTMLFKGLSKLGYRKNEPVHVPREEPKLFCSLLQQNFDRAGSFEKVCETLLCSTDQFDDIAYRCEEFVEPECWEEE